MPPNLNPAGSPHHLRSSSSQRSTVSPTKIPTPAKPVTAKGPKEPKNKHHICNICKDDTELRQSLKEFDLSEFNSKTAQLKDLDVELSDRIKEINNVNLRIQHLLLSEPAFTEEKTRMLNIQSLLQSHFTILEEMKSEMDNNFSGIQTLCNSILAEVSALKDIKIHPLKLLVITRHQ